MPWCVRTHQTAVKRCWPGRSQSLPKLNRRSVMVMIRPTVSTDAPNLAATSTPLFYAAAGWLALAAGALLVIGQAIWWPFDQQGNVATSQNNIFNAGTVIY